MTAYQFFVTGTDTDVGKTTIACALLAKAQQQNLSTLGVKPVASGCQVTPEGLRNADALSLQQQSSVQLSYEVINPFRFEPAIAPHIAAKEVSCLLTVNDIQQALSLALTTSADFSLIEGAGGWRVPLNDTQYLADLAKVLRLPVILVVGVRLGCVNHALLTKDAILADGLTIAAWVANVIDPDTHRLTDNLDTLQQQLNLPCLGVVPYSKDATAAQLANYLTIDPLINHEVKHEH